MYGMLSETKGSIQRSFLLRYQNSEELEFPRLLELLFVSVLFTMHGCMYMYNVFYLKTCYLETVFNTDLMTPESTTRESHFARGVNVATQVVEKPVLPSSYTRAYSFLSKRGPQQHHICLQVPICY